MDTRAPDRKPAFLSGVFFFLSLQDLFHKVTHGLGSLVLFLPGGVGVGPQGEPGVEVAQHGGHCFYVYTVLQSGGGKGMAEIMKSEMLQPGVLQNFLVEVYHAVRVVHLSGEGRGARGTCRGCPDTWSVPGSASLLRSAEWILAARSSLS